MAVDRCLDEEACGADFSKHWMVFVFVLICIGGGCGGGRGFFWQARARAEVFVVNCAIVLEDDNTEADGGASGFTFFVKKVVFFAK